MCEQQYHGVVRCALGWACWKTYLGRPEADLARRNALTVLGNGLQEGNHQEDALAVKEAELAVERRVGASEADILTVQTNLANSYSLLGRDEEALPMRRDVYSGCLKLNGEEHNSSILAANNYAVMLKDLRHFEEAKSLLQKTMPVARRVLGEGHDLTLRMRWIYAEALYKDSGATLDDLHEAVTTLEETTRIARRVFGGVHPLATGIERSLLLARSLLRARDTPPSGGA